MVRAASRLVCTAVVRVLTLPGEMSIIFVVFHPRPPFNVALPEQCMAGKMAEKGTCFATIDCNTAYSWPYRTFPGSYAKFVVSAAVRQEHPIITRHKAHVCEVSQTLLVHTYCA